MSITPVGRFLAVIVGLPVSVAIVALAVANRRPVTLSLDPFSPDTPVISVTVPLFAVIFGALILGLVIGGLVTWARQGRYRRAARRARRDLAAAEVRHEAQMATATALPAVVRR